MIRSKSQTLITGVYRTGSEFITQLINCHPHISATMYRVNVLRFIYDRYDPIADRHNQQAALDDLVLRLKNRYDLSLNQREILVTLTNIKDMDYGKFYDAVMCSLYLKPPVNCWAEKNQLLWREIPLFLDIMSNGKAILIIRDPRAILLSFKKFTHAPPPAYIGAVFNSLDAMQHGIEFQKKYPKNKFCLIRYEDAATNPDKTARMIWKFLELEETYKIDERSNWKDAYGQYWHANSSFHQNIDLNPFDVKSSVDRWKNGLNNHEIALVESVCGKVMAEYGYSQTQTSHDWLSIFRLFAHDDTITQYFRDWLISGQGIEAFPTDPLNPANWNRPPKKPIGV